MRVRVMFQLILGLFGIRSVISEIDNKSVSFLQSSRGFFTESVDPRARASQAYEVSLPSLSPYSCLEKGCPTEKR